MFTFFPILILRCNRTERLFLRKKDAEMAEKVKTKEELAERLADLADPPITADDISDKIFDEYNQTIEEWHLDTRDDYHYVRLNKWTVEYIHEEIEHD